jgi:hypothetical protein
MKWDKKISLGRRLTGQVAQVAQAGKNINRLAAPRVQLGCILFSACSAVKSEISSNHNYRLTIDN